MKKPKILISTSNIHNSSLETITGDTELFYTDRQTAKIVIKAGGLPMYLPSDISLSEEDIAQYLSECDGILLTGADTNVNPLLYGESPTVLKGRVDDERDQIDINITKAAYKKRLPILGICKGAQVINVALGGTLYQNIAMQYKSAIKHDLYRTTRSNFTHTIRLNKKSLLYSIFKKEVIPVNSAHEQAVKELAKSLSITAVASDGVIEAFEGKKYPFLMGLQFHAELRSFDHDFFKIFQTFIKECQR